MYLHTPRHVYTFTRTHTHTHTHTPPHLHRSEKHKQIRRGHQGLKCGQIFGSRRGTVTRWRSRKESSGVRGMRQGRRWQLTHRWVCMCSVCVLLILCFCIRAFVWMCAQLHALCCILGICTFSKTKRTKRGFCMRNVGLPSISQLPSWVGQQ